VTDQNAPYPGPDAQSTPRFVAQASAESTSKVAPQDGIGPYTLREWIVIGAAALLLILSFFSRAQGSTFIGYAPVWTLGIAWVPAVVVPLLAASLIALRRVNNVTNFGSLSVDQLASVSFVGAAITWLHVAVTLGSLASWVTWVALIISLAGVFFTVFARFVAPFSDDFVGREETVAHVAARPVAPAAAPYAAPQPNPFAAPAAQQTDPFQASAGSDPFRSSAGASSDVDRFAPPAPSQEQEQEQEQPAATADASADEVEAHPATEVVSTVDAESLDDDRALTVEESPSVAQPETDVRATPAAGQQPFWALVPEERDVHDFEGHAIYKIGPTAWALVLEDRGTYFVMRHDDGRVGYLHNVAGVTRG
jgi:hypothetical protein